MIKTNGATKVLLATILACCFTLFMGVGAVLAQMDFSPSAQPQQSLPVTTEVASVPMPPVEEPNTGVVITDPYGMAANKVYTGQRITLDFQSADIHNILRLIGEVSGKNVVVSDQVSGKVTLRLKNVPWDEALDTVLASKNLGVIESGNILRIDTVAAIRAATPDISDPATKVAMVKKIFTPKYASVSSLATELDKGKSMRGTVKVIGNDIYVEDDISTMAAITQIFMRNDRVTKQILIEARIVEATASFTQTLGIRWGGAYDKLSNWEGKSIPGYFGEQDNSNIYPTEFFGAMDINAAARLGVGFLNKAGTLALTAELNASETVGQTKIVSAPRIMAANDQEVYIKQGHQIPYRSGGTTTTPANTEFKDAVMELRVTPHIEENGQIVTLDITLTKDSPGARFEGTSEPSIDTREARTKLMVKDGETVVIGGIITDDQTTGSSRVPGLHNIPLLGWLFQNRQITNEKVELMIFITANIIPINI
ncbi:MAG: type IV pilus secretin PilQ [Deltaproteobacteria bacterium]|jgi:type IV pilus assembly protein PilQ|nr:type IV pilus secretin PilQ [Deltaproteobacteria bacterium]